MMILSSGTNRECDLDRQLVFRRKVLFRNNHLLLLPISKFTPLAKIHPKVCPADPWNFEIYGVLRKPDTAIDFGYFV